MKKAKTEFDPRAGEAAFQKLEDTLRTMPSDEVLIPNTDPQDSAIAALSLVDVARDPARQGRLAMVPPELLAQDAVDQLETAAWATWFAHTRVLSELVGASGAKVEASVYEASGQHLAKMLKLLDYHVGQVAEVAAEIADIRGGTGYQDRASDLVRAAVLWDRWRGELQDDKRLFDAQDGVRARAMAEAVVKGLRTSMQASLAQWADLRNRAWTLLVRHYNEVRAAGEFVFRKDAAERDLFLSLRQAVNPARPRSKSEDAASVSTSTIATTPAS